MGFDHSSVEDAAKVGTSIGSLYVHTTNGGLKVASVCAGHVCAIIFQKDHIQLLGERFKCNLNAIVLWEPSEMWNGRRAVTFQQAYGKGLIYCLRTFKRVVVSVRQMTSNELPNVEKESNERSGVIGNNQIDIWKFCGHMLGLYHMLRLGATS